MKRTVNRVHHVIGMVRPENFESAISKMSLSLQTPCYGPFDRPDHGIRVAISMDAGIELIAPLATDKGDQLIASLNALGERWISVVVAVRNLDKACE